MFPMFQAGTTTVLSNFLKLHGIENSRDANGSGIHAIAKQNFNLTKEDLHRHPQRRWKRDGILLFTFVRHPFERFCIK